MAENALNPKPEHLGVRSSRFRTNSRPPRPAPSTPRDDCSRCLAPWGFLQGYTSDDCRGFWGENLFDFPSLDDLGFRFLGSGFVGLIGLIGTTWIIGIVAFRGGKNDE